VQSIKKILVITHEASFGGAPILLLRLMRLLKDEGYIFNTLVMQDGPLYKEFDAISAQCAVYKKVKKNVRERIKAKVLGNENIPEKLLEGIDCIFSNTIVNGKVLKEKNVFSSIPVVSYIHELATVTAMTTTKETLEAVLKSSNLFLTPCKTVEDFIVSSFSIKQSRIARLNYFMPTTTAVSAVEIKTFKDNHNISASFIVGSLATLEWRKGADIFLQVVSSFFSEYPNEDAKFLWMGNYSENERLKFLYDAAKLNITDKILLLPSSASVEIFWNAVDVLLLPSREDPYPVVVMEAAAHKVPAICFENAGGAPEFIGTDAGTVVSYLDSAKMSDSVFNYYHQPDLLKVHGKNAFEKVKKLHGDKEFIKKQFEEALAKIEL